MINAVSQLLEQVIILFIAGTVQLKDILSLGVTDAKTSKQASHKTSRYDR